jgi:hypothetical protein
VALVVGGDNDTFRYDSIRTVSTTPTGFQFCNSCEVGIPAWWIAVGV